jgi:hypothetical protein
MEEEGGQDPFFTQTGPGGTIFGFYATGSDIADELKLVCIHGSYAIRRLGKAESEAGRKSRSPACSDEPAGAIKNVLFLVNEIKRGTRKRALGGKAFVELAKSTITRMDSSKALIDTGFQVNLITQRILADRAFVGPLRGTANKDGDDVVNIGATREYGATIQHSNGAVIVIPPHPFLHPTMEKYRERIIENY